MVNSNALLREGSGIGQGFAEYMDREARGHRHVSTPGVTRQAIRFLEGRAEDQRPFFLSLLYFDPHYAYLDHEGIDFARVPTGRIRGGQTIHELRDLGPSLNEEEIRTLKDLYDEEVRFTDAGIGQVLDALTRLGLDGSTVVIVTSDHGEEFFEHGWLGHTRNLYDTLLHVPLLLHAPPWDGSPGVLENPVSTVSIAPTLHLLCDLGGDTGSYQAPPLGRTEPSRIPDLLAEVDFVPIQESGADKLAKQRALRSGAKKLIVDELRGRTQLFDLGEDPGELEDLSEADPATRELMSLALERLAARLSGTAVDAEAGSTTTPEEAATLRALGYLDED